MRKLRLNVYKGRFLNYVISGMKAQALYNELWSNHEAT